MSLKLQAVVVDFAEIPEGEFPFSLAKARIRGIICVTAPVTMIKKRLAIALPFLFIDFGIQLVPDGIDHMAVCCT